MRQPPEKSGSEKWDEFAQAGLEALPGVGSLLGYGYQKLVAGGYDRRLEAWRQELVEVVDWLEAQYAGIADNEVLIDAVVNSTRAAQATHQHEKLEALRNAVRNSIAPGAPDVDEQARFFRLVDQFSAAHLHLLNFLHDAAAVFERDGRTPPATQFGGLGNLLEDAIPSFANRREWYDLLMGDLRNAQLAPGDRNTLHTTITGDGLYQDHLTGLGRRFLAFITDAR